MTDIVIVGDEARDAVESLTADIDFAYLFNSNPGLGFSSAVIQIIETALRGM